MYYITICCQKRICRFGKIENEIMYLNELGKIANDEWRKLHERFNNIELDIFQIMPNHMHAILIMNDIIPGLTTGAGVNPARTTARTTVENKLIYLGDIIGAFKSLVFNECLEIYKIRNEIMGKLWHRNYWEHIIRNEKSYNRIVEYINNNPMNWSKDKFNTDIYPDFDVKDFTDDFDSEIKNNN